MRLGNLADGSVAPSVLTITPNEIGFHSGVTGSTSSTRIAARYAYGELKS